MTNNDPRTRVAQPGERCDCGEPARMAFLTETHGVVPYCGGDHVTSHGWSAGEDDGLPTIVAWDCEGVPMFEDDELDARYAALIDRIRTSDAEMGRRTWFDLDLAMGHLTASDMDLSVSDEVVEVLGDLVARAHRRHRAVNRALGVDAGD